MKYRIKRAHTQAGNFTFLFPFYPLSAQYIPIQQDTDKVDMTTVLSRITTDDPADAPVTLPVLASLNAMGWRGVVNNLDKINIDAEMYPAGCYALSTGQYLYFLVPETETREAIRGYHPEQLAG